MPRFGMGVEFGILLGWHVAEGGAVTEDAVVAEIESEKPRADVSPWEDGVPPPGAYPEPGDEVPPGTPMDIVAFEAVDIADLAAEAEVELVCLPDRDTGGNTAAAGGERRRWIPMPATRCRYTPGCSVRASVQS